MSTRRICWAVAFALLIAMRLLTPAGFMPEWSGSQPRIILCDDADWQVAAPAHHHGKTGKAKHRQSCPYAAASAIPFLNAPVVQIAVLFGPESLGPTGATALDVILQRKVERPPSRGPPVLA